MAQALPLSIVQVAYEVNLLLQQIRLGNDATEDAGLVAQESSQTRAPNERFRLFTVSWSNNSTFNPSREEHSRSTYLRLALKTSIHIPSTMQTLTICLLADISFSPSQDGRRMRLNSQPIRSFQKDASGNSPGPPPVHSQH